MPMAIGSAVSFATERGGERREDRRWRRKSGPLKGRRREEGRRRGTERILGGEEEKGEGGRRWRKTNKKGRSALFAAARS